jgi:hypothetical protein
MARPLQFIATGGTEVISALLRVSTDEQEMELQDRSEGGLSRLGRTIFRTVFVKGFAK